MVGGSEHGEIRSRINGLIVWYTFGTLRDDPATGVGNAVFAYPTPTSFSLTYNETLRVGGSAASVSFTAQGASSWSMP